MLPDGSLFVAKPPAWPFVFETMHRLAAARYRSPWLRTAFAVSHVWHFTRG